MIPSKYLTYASLLGKGKYLPPHKILPTQIYNRKILHQVCPVSSFVVRCCFFITRYPVHVQLVFSIKLILRESLSESKTIKKRIKYKKKKIKKKKKEGKEKKKRLPSHSVHVSCPNFLDELPRKHLLHTRDIVPLLVEGANFCFLIFWPFDGSPPALNQKKDREMFLLYSTRPSLPLATIMEVWRSPFFRGERAWTDQRFFFLQSICSVHNRHLRTTNGSTLTLYLSFKGQRKYAARLSPFRGPTAMPCRNSCPWLSNLCPGHLNVRMREVLARPWV